MLTRDVITNTVPYLHKEDKVHHALHLMNDYHIVHLPVVEDEQYLGIVSEEQLLQSDDEDNISDVRIEAGGTSVQGNDHFLKAIQTAVAGRLSIVPVVENEQLLGIVTYTDLLRNTSEFMSLSYPGALIVLEMESRAYSFSELNRVIESCDAQLTQLNTTVDGVTGMMQVTIRLNKLEISDVISTLQRYEYTIKYYFGEEMFENELRSNFDNLMNYLNV